MTFKSTKMLGSVRSLLKDVFVTLLYASVIPAILFSLYLKHVILLGTLKISLVIFVLLFVAFPLIFKFSYKLQQGAVFLNFMTWPKNPDYSNPLRYGLQGARNFYVLTDDNIQLGVWQILPEELADTANATGDDEYFERILDNGKNVVLYNHGNAGHRVAPHRIELYSVLRRHFHVIAYDYRGYGDSSDVSPTEAGVVSDSMFMYKWIVNRTSAKVFVWGHSLGTGVSTHSLALLKEQGVRPATGLFLEAPFNNLKDEISENPLARPFKYLPWFMYTVVEPMQRNNFKFENDRHILNVDCPILILHSADDNVVPFKLGMKLYKGALSVRRKDQEAVDFIGFTEGNFGHKYICRSPLLYSIIKHFIYDSIKKLSQRDTRLY